MLTVFPEKIFISFSQVLHPSVRFWKTPKNRKVSTRMNRFESLGSTLNFSTFTFTGMILIPNPKESFKLLSLCGHRKSFFHLLEHIRHISWFLYIPFCLATLTVASKASSLLISWNAWWSASWFPQRALHNTAASLQSRICSLTWNRKNRQIFPELCRFWWKQNYPKQITYRFSARVSESKNRFQRNNQRDFHFWLVLFFILSQNVQSPYISFPERYAGDLNWQM